MSRRPNPALAGMTETQKKRYYRRNRATCDCGQPATVQGSGNGELICERCHRLEGVQDNNFTCGHGETQQTVHKLILPT